MVSESGVVVGVSSAASEDEGEVEGSVDWGSEAGRAAASVMGVSGESLAGSGGAGAWRVERHIALRRMSVESRNGYGRSSQLTILFRAPNVSLLPRELPHCRRPRHHDVAMMRIQQD